MDLIDKAEVVAEIVKMKNKAYPNSEWNHGYVISCEKLLSFINTLEVEEVDLEKEINKYISDNFFGSETMGFFAARTKEEPNDIDIALCAKYFFELGLKTKKGEKI